ncbi:MAG TPA: hypothetical protein VG711_06540 [Phycisphaerales bacterium]|nr:hypothetical protein [Phycisphaerales bacterium]
MREQIRRLVMDVRNGVSDGQDAGIEGRSERLGRLAQAAIRYAQVAASVHLARSAREIEREGTRRMGRETEAEAVEVTTEDLT